MRNGLECIGLLRAVTVHTDIHVCIIIIHIYIYNMYSLSLSLSPASSDWPYTLAASNPNSQL